MRGSAGTELADTMQAAGLASLPRELLHGIAQHLGTLSSVYALALSCRTCCAVLECDEVWSAYYRRLLPKWRPCGKPLPLQPEGGLSSFRELAACTSTPCGECSRRRAAPSPPRVRRWHRSDVEAARMQVRLLLRLTTTEDSTIRELAGARPFLVASWITVHGAESTACVDTTLNREAIGAQGARRWLHVLEHGAGGASTDDDGLPFNPVHVSRLWKSPGIEDWLPLPSADAHDCGCEKANVAHAEAAAGGGVATLPTSTEALTSVEKASVPEYACALQAHEWAALEQWGAEQMRGGPEAALLLPGLRASSLSSRIELLHRTAVIVLNDWVGRGCCMLVFEMQHACARASKYYAVHAATGEVLQISH